MRIALLALFGAASLYAAVAPIQIFEVDGVAQTGRVHTLGMIFKQGDIPNCAVPVIGGTALDTASYQCDAKTRWPDGSLKTAAISFIASLSSGQALAVSFQSGVCNNAGYLDKAGMLAFAGGAWDRQDLVTANGQTVTTSAKSMLTALSIARCQIEYELQGPIVTQVRVQDCTAAMSYDFGWHLSGGAMLDNGGTPFTGASQYASLHPVYDLRFTPSTNSVFTPGGIKNQWIGKSQDQIYSVEIKVGSPLVSVYTKASFTHFARSNWWKSFWSGTAPGHTRIDWNFPYLISTKLLPNYDLTSTVTSTVNPSTEYTAFAASDRGDVMGWATMDRDVAANDEGAMEQPETLRYLYLMGACGAVNGPCAKAWDILTGEVDGNASNTLGGSTGGGGFLHALGSIPMHADESRTGLKFFCPSYDAPNATAATACDGTEDARGHPISRDADRAIRGALAAVGDRGSSGWGLESGCEHWLNWAYVASLLIADRYYRDEMYAAASYCSTVPNPDKWSNSGNNGYWADVGIGSVSVRRMAWGIHTLGQAALVAPDGSVEKSYYSAKLRSNLMMLEGLRGITGTSLTPSSTNSSCSGYVSTSATRWNFAHCTIGRGVVPGLNGFTNGQCPIGGDALIEIDTSAATDFAETYFDSFAQISLGDLIRKGFTDAISIQAQTAKRIVEQVLDPGYNPYLTATETMPIKNGGLACLDNRGGEVYTDNPHFTTWAGVRSGYLSTIRDYTSWTGRSNFPCVDHGYSLLARGAVISALDAGITSGSYSAAAAWAWMNANVPYFSFGCGSSGDAQIKFAIVPTAAAPVTVSTQFSGAVKVSGSVR